MFYNWIHRYIAEGINGLEPRNKNNSKNRIGIYSSKEIDMNMVISFEEFNEKKKILLDNI